MILTRRQKQIADYVGDFIRKNGYAPSLVEISRHFGLSSISTIHKHLVHLEQKGLIRRGLNRARAIEVLPAEAKPAARDVPLLGLVASGQPIEPVRNKEMVAVPEDMLGRREVHLLKARGESLAPELIREGDYVIVENRDKPQNGEMVIALLDGEKVAVRKFYRDKGKIRLQPANPTAKPVLVDEAKVKVHGVVLGVLRKY